MCRRESSSLQRGMNFELGSGYSVVLMSIRRNAPYRDCIEGDGSTLIYEGHDVPRTSSIRNPKRIDQRDTNPNGSLTENGKFYEAAAAFKRGETLPHAIRVYEKIKQGIWSYNGLFRLVDAWREQDNRRMVYRFKLIAIEGDDILARSLGTRRHRRIIPTAVKLAVWKRDDGKCVLCGAKDELHFDHDLPYSKGGSSIRAENVQLLCARHNLSKGSKIL